MRECLSWCSWLNKLYGLLPVLTLLSVQALIVGGLLTGCSKQHPLVIGHENPSLAAPALFKRVWLPLQQHHNRITAVGKYRLSEALIIPVALKPFSSALVHEPERSAKQFMSIDIFFPAAKDQAVLEWAKSYPAIIETNSKVQWKYKRSQYTTYTSLSKSPPIGVPTQWLIAGEAFTDTSRYGVMWYSSISLTNQQRSKSAEFYDNVSPVRNEPCLVSVSISYYMK